MGSPKGSDKIASIIHPLSAIELICNWVNTYVPALIKLPSKEKPITILVSELYWTVKLFSSAAPPNTSISEMPSNPNWNPAKSVLDSKIISTTPLL